MKKLIKSFSVFLVILFSISSVNAATLTDRLKDGHKLRLGFGTAVPWAYAGDNGEALGFVNMIASPILAPEFFTKWSFGTSPVTTSPYFGS